MKNNSFLKKNKSLITILILFLGWFCFVFFLVLPAVKSLKINFVEVEKRKLDDKVNEEKISKLPDLKNKADLIRQDSQNLNVIFSKDQIVDLVNELEKMAEKTGNKISISVGEENKIMDTAKSKNVTEKKEDEFLKSLPVQDYFEVNMTLAGDYNSLMSFVNKLNSIKYYNSIKYFNLMLVKEEDKEGGNKPVAQSAGVSLMSSGEVENKTNEENSNNGKIFLESKIGVLFYLLEKKDEKN